MSAFLSLARWSSSAVPDAAFTLSASREHERGGGANAWSYRDCRPEILLWAVAHCEEYRDLVADYALLRVLVFAQRRGIVASADAKACATIDGMERARRRKASVGLADRARQFQMDFNHYSDLRDAAERAVLLAAREGLERYLAAYRGHLDHFSQATVNLWSADAPAVRKTRSERRGVRAARSEPVLRSKAA